MEKITGNEPAFGVGTDNYHVEGLSKREMFAMSAMQGFINTGCVRTENNNIVNNTYNYAQIAKSAVEQADALIAALNKGGENG